MHCLKADKVDLMNDNERFKDSRESIIKEHFADTLNTQRPQRSHEAGVCGLVVQSVICQFNGSELEPWVRHFALICPRCVWCEWDWLTLKGAFKAASDNSVWMWWSRERHSQRKKCDGMQTSGTFLHNHENTSVYSHHSVFNRLSLASSLCLNSV